MQHTYSSNGAFTASAVLTTTGGASSDPATCKQTITVGSGATPTPPGKLPPTGPGQTFLLIGVTGAVVTILGAIVLFAL